jgi:hypothetical protein
MRVTSPSSQSSQNTELSKYLYLPFVLIGNSYRSTGGPMSDPVRAGIVTLLVDKA